MKKINVVVSALVLSLSMANAIASQELAQKNNCLACHAVDKKLVGPAFKDVKARYAGQAGAADKLAEKIRKGGSGVWGPIPMPANPQVTPENSKLLAKWILK